MRIKYLTSWESRFQRLEVSYRKLIGEQEKKISEMEIKLKKMNKKIKLQSQQIQELKTQLDEVSKVNVDSESDDKIAKMHCEFKSLLRTKLKIQNEKIQAIDLALKGTVFPTPTVPCTYSPVASKYQPNNYDKLRVSQKSQKALLRVRNIPQVVNNEVVHAHCPSDVEKPKKRPRLTESPSNSTQCDVSPQATVNAVDHRPKKRIEKEQ